ncbi:MAG: hypothetical protein QW572_02345 [Candidatus Nitrosocaldus sp.]
MSRASREEKESRGIAITTTSSYGDDINASSNYQVCPVCGDKNKASVPKGIKVKCMRV